jgi:hypothetical protein
MLPLTDVQDGSFDRWLPLGGSGGVHLVVGCRLTARGAENDKEEEGAALVGPGDAPASHSAREEALERFLRTRGLNPAKIRATSRDDAAWRVVANWKVFDLSGLGPKRKLLRFNRECLEWMEKKKEDPEKMTLDELRDRIESIELRIAVVEAEISELEALNGDE